MIFKNGVGDQNYFTFSKYGEALEGRENWMVQHGYVSYVNSRHPREGKSG